MSTGLLSHQLIWVFIRSVFIDDDIMIWKINKGRWAVSNEPLHQLQRRAAWSFEAVKVHSGASERVLWDKYRQADDGAASEVDDIVDCDHLQVQHHLPRSLDGTGQDKCGAHIAGLLGDKEGRRGMWGMTFRKWLNLTAPHDGGHPKFGDLVRSLTTSKIKVVRQPMRSEQGRVNTEDRRYAEWSTISGGRLNHATGKLSLRSWWKVSTHITHLLCHLLAGHCNEQPAASHGLNQVCLLSLFCYVIILLQLIRSNKYPTGLTPTYTPSIFM